MSDDTQGPVFKFVIRAIISGILAAFISGLIVGGVFVVFNILGAEDKLNNMQVAVAVFLSSWLPWYMYWTQLND